MSSYAGANVLFGFLLRIPWLQRQAAKCSNVYLFQFIKWLHQVRVILFAFKSHLYAFISYQEHNMSCGFEVYLFKTLRCMIIKNPGWHLNLGYNNWIGLECEDF